MKVTCFLSHAWSSGADERAGHAFAMRLAEALEGRGIGSLWLDSREVHGNLEDAITQGVKECAVFLVLLSPDTLASDWCQRELGIALVERGRTGVRIVPVVWRDCEPPHSIVDLVHVDFQDDAAFAQAVDRLEGVIKDELKVWFAVRDILDGDGRERAGGAQRLAEYADRYAVPILARRLSEEPDPTIRYWLAFALGRTGGSEARSALADALDREKDMFARRGIEQALAATENK